MFTKHDIKRNACQLYGGQAKCGYDWWWHSFTARHIETGEEKSFYVEFFVCNPAYGEIAPVFDDKKPSYLMVNVGTWGKNAKQLHRFFGWKSIEVDMSVPFQVKASDCYMTENKTWGRVVVSEEESQNPNLMSDAGEISWNLNIEKVIPFNVGYGAGSLFRKMQLFEMFWHAEGMKSKFSGTISVDGETYTVRAEDCYGYSDKNWGKNFTTPWVWLSSNNLTSELTGNKLENSVFDIGGGRPKVGPVVLDRKLLSAFYYEGRLFEFNFSKLWTNTKTEFNCKETDDEIIWHVEQKSSSGKMVTDITCNKAEMLNIRYQAPTGEKRHTRLWNGGNGVGTVVLYDKKGELIDRIHCENVGCEYGEFDADGPY